MSTSMIGRCCRPSFSKIAFMANEECHAHTDYEPVATESITLSADKTTLYVGDTTKATAIVNPSNADDKSVTYASDNEAVATIDENGNIVVKNPSAFWLPEVRITDEIGGTEYTVTGSYEGTETLDKKLKRIMERNAADKESDITEDDNE